ncbi:MAG: hypothetical protein JSU89_12195, partial [Myxococcales bacterium]
LPPGWTAERAALDYVRWLPGFLRWLLRVQRHAGEAFSFNLVPFGIKLLMLSHSANRSSTDRQLFYVVGGILARGEAKARFELRQVLDGRTLLTVVHDYEPRLPWLLYVATQAHFHRWLMHRFASHLLRETDAIETKTQGGLKPGVRLALPVRGSMGTKERETWM